MQGGLDGVLASLEIQLQPIIETATGDVWAYEALARFAGQETTDVANAIALAHGAGYGPELEIGCLEAALARRAQLPAGARLTLNVSPDVLAGHAVMRALDHDLRGVVLEVTEHQHVADIDTLRAELAQVRERGAEIAVDDVGSGYAGLLRLATLRPDYVKLDRTIVHGVGGSEAQQAVLEALVTFSHRLNAAVVGEGVESAEDLASLIELDVDFGQGWFIGLPSRAAEPVSAAVAELSRSTRRDVLQRGAGGGAAASRAQRMHTVVGAMGAATQLAALHAAGTRAAEGMRVDAISALVLDADGMLREITSSGAAIDVRGHPVADFPPRRSVLQTGNVVEVHASDPDADAVALDRLRADGNASMLIVPIELLGNRVGVLEFGQRSHRRWTGTDVADACGFATHIANALARITG